jgi:hypothetical protein
MRKTVRKQIDGTDNLEGISNDLRLAGQAGGFSRRGGGRRSRLEEGRQGSIAIHRQQTETLRGPPQHLMCLRCAAPDNHCVALLVVQATCNYILIITAFLQIIMKERWIKHQELVVPTKPPNSESHVGPVGRNATCVPLTTYTLNYLHTPFAVTPDTLAHG